MSSNEIAVTPATAGDGDRAPGSENEPGGAEMQQNATFCNTSGGVQLTVKQQQALEMLLHGDRDSGVARVVGVDRVTLWRWQTQDPAFISELARRRKLLWNLSGDRCRRLLLKAIDVLERDLDDQYGKSSRAAMAVLQMCGRFAPAPEPEPNAKAEGVNRS
jgi:hypothetical protein